MNRDREEEETLATSATRTPFLHPAVLPVHLCLTIRLKPMIPTGLDAMCGCVTKTFRGGRWFSPQVILLRQPRTTPLEPLLSGGGAVKVSKVGYGNFVFGHDPLLHDRSRATPQCLCFAKSSGIKSSQGSSRERWEKSRTSNRPL